MANLFSDAIVNAVAGDSPWDQVLHGGKFLMCKGAAQASPEDAMSAADVVFEMTKDQLVFLAAIDSLMTVTFTAIDAAQTVQITVGGIPIHPLFTAATTVEADEAQAFADQVNNASIQNLGIRASVIGAVVTLHGPLSSADTFNGAVVAKTGTATTITLSGNFAGGVAGANMVEWVRNAAILNQLNLPAADTISGEVGAGFVQPVTITHFRYIMDDGDTGITDDSVNKVYRRWQGTVGGVTNGAADLKFPLTSSAVATGVKIEIGTYTFTIPSL